MKTLNFSIIIPTFNMSEHMESLWNSLNESGLAHLAQELIFVNDGSTDDTQKILLKLKNGDSPYNKKIKIIENEKNKGRFLTRFIGAQTAQSKKILFLDSRVQVDKKFCKALTEGASQFPALIPNVEIDIKKNIFSLYWDRSHKKIFSRHYRDTKKPLQLTPDNYDRYLKGTTAFYCDRDFFLECCEKYKNEPLLNDDTFLLKDYVQKQEITLYPDLRIQWSPRETWIEFLARLWERGPSFTEYHVFERKTGPFFYSVILGFIFIIFLLLLSFIAPLYAFFIILFSFITIILTTILFSTSFKEFILLAPLHTSVILVFGLGIIYGFFINLFKKKNLYKIIIPIFIVLIFIFLSFVYLWPATENVFLNGHVIGRGEDEKPLVFYYSWIPKLFEISPFSFLNGALYWNQAGAPYGQFYWIPYSERFLALIFSYFATPEQITFLFILSIYLINGLLCVWVARVFKFSWINSLTFGIAMTFAPFTYWRGMMHLVLAGIYYIPLLFLFFHYALKKSTFKNTLLASFFLFAISSSAHYSIIITLTLLPIFFLVLLYFKPKKEWFFLLLTTIPFIISLFWMKQATLFGLDQLQIIKNEFIDTRSENPNRKWDLLVYSARPLAYLTGNFDRPDFDLNPIRVWFTQKLMDKESGNWYPQEHAIGMRWILIFLFICAIFQIKKFPQQLKPYIVLCIFLALWSYWCSLSPRSISPLGIGIGPSRWIQEVFPMIRAPNRWAPVTHFSIGFMGLLWFSFIISKKFSQSKQKIWSLFLFLIVLFEFLPTFKFPSIPPINKLHWTSPSNTNLDNTCGLGIFLPYNKDSLNDFISIRSTNCHILNGQEDPQKQSFLYDQLNSKTNWLEKSELLNCLAVQWISIDLNSLDNNKIETACNKLGFVYSKENICIQKSPLSLKNSLQKSHQCFQKYTHHQK